MRERALTSPELCAGIIRSWVEPSPLLAAEAQEWQHQPQGRAGPSGSERTGDSWCWPRRTTDWAHKGKGGLSPCGLPRPGVPVLFLLPLPKAMMDGPGEDLGKKWW